MTKRIVVVLMAVGVAMVTATALPAAVDPGDGPQKRLVVKLDGSDASTLRLEDLRDGESRSFGSGGREVTVTRKGDEVEVTALGEDGQRTVLLSTASLPHCEGGPDGTRKVIVRTLDVASNGAQVEVTDGAAEVRKVVVCRHGGEPGAEAITLDTAALAHECHADDASVSYRCRDDEATLTLPKARAPQAVPACPVCGRPMEVGPARHVLVKTVVLESKDEL